MKVLIPGGAGYIGSHTVKHVQDLGHEVTVIDDFSTGNDFAVSDCEVIRLNLLDNDKLLKALKGRQFDGAIHFAAKSLVEESINKPDYYYQNNITGSINLVNALLQNDIQNLIFSSTAAIFGIPQKQKINEEHQKLPINPYGKSKLFVENIFKDIVDSYQMNITCLRYFNAAGADPSGKNGEERDQETHLIPSILKSLIYEEKELKIYGNDYDTKDGTCIRDYVHVCDLANAHLLSLEKHSTFQGFSEYNLGNGEGFSIMQIIQSCERVTGKTINYQIAKRRKGDPSQLVADNFLASSKLGWNPVYKDIDSIVESAWNWHSREIF